MAIAPTISIPGIGSELDVESIVSALVEVRRKPALDRYNSQIDTSNNQISAIGALRSALSDWQEITFNLKLDATYNLRSVNYDSTTATDFFTVTADSTAELSEYDVKVDQVAKSQKITTNFGFTSGEAVGGGSLSIATASGGTFNINVSATDTVVEVAAAINSTVPSLKASTISSDLGTYLVLESELIGMDSAFAITVTDDDGLADGNGLSRIQYDTTYSANMATINLAQDAVITIDGAIMATSKTNVFENVIPGVTLSVKQEHTGASTSNKFTLTQDNESIKSTLKDFVEKYNQFIDVYNRVVFINRDEEGNLIEQPDDDNIDLSTLTPEEREQRELDKQKGVFAFDGVIRNMLFQMRNLLSESVRSINKVDSVALASFGIEEDATLTGKLTLNESKLDAGLASKSDDLKLLLMGEDGIATRLDAKIKEFEQVGGLLQSKSTQLTELQKDLTTGFQTLTERLVEYEARLYTQYVRLDKISAQMNAAKSFLDQQFNNMNNK